MQTAALTGIAHGYHSEHHHPLKPDSDGGQGNDSTHNTPKHAESTPNSESGHVRAFTMLSPAGSPAHRHLILRDMNRSNDSDNQIDIDLDSRDLKLTRKKERSFARRTRADSSSSSESEELVDAEKRKRKISRLTKQISTMSSSDTKKVLRLNDDLNKQHDNGDGLDENKKLALFKSAVNKVIVSNRFRPDSKRKGRKEPAIIEKKEGVEGEGGTAMPKVMRRRSGSEAVQISAKEIDSLRELNVMAKGSILDQKEFKLSRRSLKNGIARFFTDDETGVGYDDYDAGVNSMALLCGLVLGVPYQVLSSLDYSNLDWLKAELEMCPKDDWTYNHIYTGYRMAYTGTVYFSVSGMVFATFYFLFKRNDIADFLVWRRKARAMVVIQFFTTALAMISLILLTNLYFEFFLINTEADICNTGSGPYVGFGMGLAGICFCMSFYLIW